MDVLKIAFVLVLDIYFCITSGTGQVCGPGLLLTFVKIPGVVPRTAYPPVLLYSAVPGTVITAECYNRCRSTSGCDGFILDYRQGACFKVSVGRQYEEYSQHTDVNFFRKVCLRVPEGCTNRAWPVEYVPGFQLLGNQHRVFPNISDKWQCAQLCLDQSFDRDVPCHSSQYQAWSRTCTLSQYDRYSSPDSFVPSTQFDFDYIENQCPQVTQTDSCWHEPLTNQSLLTSDLEIHNTTLTQCEDKCISERYFQCRAYTYQCPTPVTSRCLLHSDSGFSPTGRPTPLVSLPCAIYKERIPCVNLTISCSSNAMLITLMEKSFSGQLFVLGRADQCSVSGNNQDTLSLLIPVPEFDSSINKCQVTIVKGIGQINRTLASTVIVVQKHKLIQTISDRVIKVTCLLTDNMTIPFYNNVTLGATFGVQDPSIQTVIEGVGENVNGTAPPNARLRIIDLGRGGAEATETQLGEELELRIDVDPPYNVSMLRAGHLIASSGSGQDSLLLLDLRGCPPDPTTFPALIPDGPTTLVARFRAFKFPDSPVIRFSLVLTFCQTICQPTDCGNGLVSYGKRRRRSLNETEIPLLYKEIMEEVPLQLSITVRVIDLQKNETKLTPNLEVITDHICVDLSSVLLLATALVVVQLVILIVCCLVLRNREKQSDQVSLQSDFSTKQMNWADHLTSDVLNPSYNRGTRNVNS